MGIKKIIKEEIDDFDWVKETPSIKPISDVLDMPIGVKYKVVSASEWSINHFDDDIKDDEYSLIDGIYVSDGELTHNWDGEDEEVWVIPDGQPGEYGEMNGAWVPYEDMMIIQYGY